MVAGAAALLTEVLRHNAAVLPRLYSTGAFFFALSYCGSNLVELASLLRVRRRPQWECLALSARPAPSFFSTTLAPWPRLTHFSRLVLLLTSPSAGECQA